MNISYQKVLEDSKKNGYSIAAFNVVNAITTEAVIKAAEELNKPVITQISTSTVKKIGIQGTLEMLENARRKAKVPVIIHLDHCPELEYIKECIKGGFQSVMFDGSHLGYEENIKMTKEVVEYAKAYHCHVEGEVGVISGVEDGVGSDYGVLASFDETVRYINETGIDAIAPAVGTAHGLYNGEPHINFELIERLANETECPVVIHGGTGLTEERYRELVKAGSNKINISTALKHSYINAIKTVGAIEDLPINPLHADQLIMEEVKKDMKRYIELFS